MTGPPEDQKTFSLVIRKISFVCSKRNLKNLLFTAHLIILFQKKIAFNYFLKKQDIRIVVQTLYIAFNNLTNTTCASYILCMA